MPAGDPPALLRLTTRETDGPLLEDGVAMVMLCGGETARRRPDGGGGGLRRWSADGGRSGRSGATASSPTTILSR